MYKFTSKPGLTPLEGVPQHDLSDEEFAKVAEWYESTFGEEGKGVLAASGWFKHVKEKQEDGPVNGS